MTFRTWMEKQLHIPSFMRDFHDAKNLFKAIAHWKQDDPKDPYYVPWTNAQCYVIETFLRFMALHGYTLQRSRTKIDGGDQFYDVYKTVEDHREKLSNIFIEMLEDNAKERDEKRKRELEKESDATCIPACDH